MRRPLAVTLAIVVAVGLLSGCWPQQGFGPERSRWNPFEDQVTGANVATLHEEWSIDFPGFPHGEPIISSGSVFVTWKALSGAGDAGVTALDPQTGATRWNRRLSGDGEFVARIVPVTTIDGELWTAISGRNQAGGCFGRSFRLDPADGAVIERVSGYRALAAQTGDDIVEPMNRYPCRDKDVVDVVVRETDSGDILWQDNSPLSVFLAEPTVTHDKVFLGDDVYSLAGCGAPTCEPVGELDHPHEIVMTIGSSPERLYGLSLEGSRFGTTFSLVAYDPTTLVPSPVWATDSAFVIFPAFPAIAADDETVFLRQNQGPVIEEDRLHAFDGSGCGAPSCAPVWSSPDLTRGLAAGPIVAGGLVYVAEGGESSSAVHAFDADGCGDAICSPVATVPDVGLVDQMVVSDGRLVMTTSVGDGVHQVRSYAPGPIDGG